MNKTRLPVDQSEDGVNTWLRGLGLPKMRQAAYDDAGLARELADVTGQDVRVTDDVLQIARELD